MQKRQLLIATLTVSLWSTLPAEAFAAPFQIGDFVTNTQESWGGTPTPGNAAQLLVDQFVGLYGGGVEVGVTGNAGFSMIFTGIAPVLNYLPSSGSPGSLNQDFIDPTSTLAGLFGGSVLALQFNVDFSDAGYLIGSAGIPLGDLVLWNLPFTPEFNELTVRQFLAIANTRLGGGPGSATYDALAALTEDLNSAFASGEPSAFAQDHLQVGGQTVPEPATLSLLGFAAAAVSMRRLRYKQRLQ
jgi:hypothetical protein